MGKNLAWLTVTVIRKKETDMEGGGGGALPGSKKKAHVYNCVFMVLGD